MQQHLHEPPAIDTLLARNLVTARLRAGLTQFELAAAARVSRATIAQLESGDSDPRLSTLVEIAKALRISPLALLSDPRPAATHQQSPTLVSSSASGGGSRVSPSRPRF